MSQGKSTEMIAANLFVGWLYVRSVREYLEDLINDKGWPISFYEKIGFFENKFVVYGKQNDLIHISNHISAWMKTV